MMSSTCGRGSHRMELSASSPPDVSLCIVVEEDSSDVEMHFTNQFIGGKCSQVVLLPFECYYSIFSTGTFDKTNILFHNFIILKDNLLLLCFA